MPNAADHYATPPTKASIHRAALAALQPAISLSHAQQSFISAAVCLPVRTLAYSSTHSAPLAGKF